MKTLHLVRYASLVALTSAAFASMGCETHERVVVRERPEVVRVAPAPVVVTERPVVVQERVIVRP